MAEITVNASKRYSVYLDESGSEKRLVNLLSNFGKHVCIVTDEGVPKCYLERIASALSLHGYSEYVFFAPESENAKTASVLLSLLAFLAENHFGREDTLIALGGGAVGDLSGFAASCYNRGMHLINIPTTLLSMVDSSIGGKNGIDLPDGKNLVGTFYQPDAVLIDTDFLKTLSPGLITDGYGEIVKTAAIGDPKLFGMLESDGGCDIEETVLRCINVKRSFVEQDEFDEGKRHILNFGHTVAHAIEAASGFSVSHGRAVAIGCSLMTRACEAAGICGRTTADRVDRVLNRYCGNIKSPFLPKTLTEFALRDKKRQGDNICPVLIEEIGRCTVKSMSIDEFSELITGAEQCYE